MSTTTRCVRGGAFRAAGLCRRRASVPRRLRARQSRSQAQGVFRARRPVDDSLLRLRARQHHRSAHASLTTRRPWRRACLVRHCADGRAADHRRQADRTWNGYRRNCRVLNRRSGGGQPGCDRGRRSTICAFRVQQATVLVAICIVVTSIVVPILTGLWYRRFGQSMARTESPTPALRLHSVDRAV